MGDHQFELESRDQKIAELAKEVASWKGEAGRLCDIICSLDLARIYKQAAETYKANAEMLPKTLSGQPLPKGF